MFDRLVVTCEHATNWIPGDLCPLFRGASAVLESHRAYDIGALEVARFLARRLGARLETGQVSRLIVDLNRSERHRDLFSEFVRDLPPARKQLVLDRYYRPYRSAVTRALSDEAASERRVLHTSIHSFTPVLAGVVRNADVGILYDPARAVECRAVAELIRRLRESDPKPRIRRNYPYRGTADGLTTAMRREPWADRYAGVEIELNQGYLGDPAVRKTLVEGLVRTVGSLLIG